MFVCLLALNSLLKMILLYLINIIHVMNNLLSPCINQKQRVPLLLGESIAEVVKLESETIENDQNVTARKLDLIQHCMTS
jgi:hypothetical protein